MKNIVISFFFLCMVVSSAFIQASGTTEMQIKTLSDGSMVAIWQVNNGSQAFIQAAEYTQTSGWSTPTTISTPGEQSLNPQLYINPLDHIVVGWIAADNVEGVLTLKANKKLAGSSWGTPVRLSNKGIQVQNFSISVDPFGGSGGNATAIWNTIDPTSNMHGISMSTTTFNGNWVASTSIE